MNNIIIIDNLEIITNNNKRICKKKTKKNIISLLKYLKSKDFYNFIHTEYIDNYEVREYINEIDNVTIEEKLHELIYIMTMLHIKTTHYKNISVNDIKRFYEKTTDELVNIKKYYNDILEQNDIYLFLKPSINLLIKKISLLFISIDNSKFFLDKWYEIVKNKKRKRVVINHNNLKISNLIISDKAYLINFNNYIIDYPIYDIISIFKNNYKKIDMIDLFNEYYNKYNLFEEELYLLYSLLLKIDKIDFNNNEIITVRIINDLIIYLEKVSFFLEYCMKNKK